MRSRHPVRHHAILLAVMLVIAPAAMTGCGRETPPPPASTALSPAQRQAAGEALDKLQKKFSLAINNDRSPKPLIAPAQALAAKYPGYAPTHLLLGQMWLKLLKTGPALEALNKALALNPDQPEAQRLAGSVLMLEGRYDDAAASYAKAINLRPNDADFRVFRANALIKADHPEQARDELLRALRLDSGSGRGHALLAQVYAKLGESAKARTQINAAIGSVPGDDTKTRPLYIRMKARMLRQGGHPAKALALLKKLPAKQRLIPEVSDEMAQCMADLGQPQRAAVFFEQLLIFQPDNAHAAAAATRWRLKVGDLDQARDDLNTLRRINPKHSDIAALAKQLRQAKADER